MFILTYVLQVVIGKKKTHEVPKSMIMCQLDCYKHWSHPEVGEIVERKNQEITVHWFQGTKTSTWKQWNVQGAPWQEAIYQNDVRITRHK